MDWREHIYSNPEIGGGKPIFRGTRIKVAFVLKLMAAGWPYEQIEQEYPGVQRDHLRAAAAFAADMMQDEDYIAIGQAQTV